MQWTKTPTAIRCGGWIVDTHTGEIEMVIGRGVDHDSASADAYAKSRTYCGGRNRVEGWLRFAAFTQQAADAAGVVARYYAGLDKSAG